MEQIIKENNTIDLDVLKTDITMLAIYKSRSKRTVYQPEDHTHCTTVNLNTGNVSQLEKKSFMRKEKWRGNHHIPTFWGRDIARDLQRRAKEGVSFFTFYLDLMPPCDDEKESKKELKKLQKKWNSINLTLCLLLDLNSIKIKKKNGEFVHTAPNEYPHEELAKLAGEGYIALEEDSSFLGITQKGIAKGKELEEKYWGGGNETAK